MAALPVWRFIGSAVSLRRIFPLGLVLLAAFLPAPAAIAASQDAIKDDASAIRGLPCYHRGVAIHNMMNWAAVEPSNPGRYVSPAFVGPNYETSDALLRHVAAAGFDFIRLTIDPGPFLQFSGPDREALDRHLKRVVERLLGKGFCVIVDFHPNSQVAKYAPEKLVQALDDPLFVAYAGVIKQTAHLLAAMHSNRVAIELMNEPQYGWDPATTERWQRLLEYLYRGVARTVQLPLLRAP
jgi:endoglucanase